MNKSKQFFTLLFLNMKTSRFVLIMLFFLVLFYSCEQIEKISGKIKTPTVTTSPISEDNGITAKSGGCIISDGGSPVTACGVCYAKDSTKLEPVIYGPAYYRWFTTDSSINGCFNSTIVIQAIQSASLARFTHYVRAYATNKKGTAYGKIYSFNPKNKPPSEFKSITLKNLTTVTATIYGLIGYYDGLFIIKEGGLCWGTTTNPSIEGNYISSLSLGTGSPYEFTITLNNLLPNTTYYIRGYAKNESGIVYSPEISITTWKGSVTDASGNLYQIITIGSQDWMGSNLTTSKFNDGSVIQAVTDNLQWSALTSPGSCEYSYNGQAAIGKLYNYFAITDNRKLCPTGWHIPSDNEWKTLEKYLGMSQDQADATGSRGNDEGGKLKSTNIGTDWNYSSTGATNTSGFTAKGAGYRYDNGLFSSYGQSGNFWTITESDASNAWCRYLTYNSAQINRLAINKKYGFSIRCVKD
jgi:uncharacterized protein (TIGR02145 family)